MEYVVTRIKNDELEHHGILGMKWGVRRYQNKDGSLTEAGKKRMYREQFDMESKERKEQKKYTAEPSRWVKEDMTRSKKLAEDTSTLTNKMKNINDKAARNAPKEKMDLSNMSDKELRDRINREFLERQYNDMFAPQTTSKGREYTGKVLEVAGDVLGVTASALAVALSIRSLMRGD